MNRSCKTLLTLTSALLLSVSAQAMTNMENGEAYIGAKAGQFFVDQNGFDDVIAYGGYVGYTTDQNFGFEAEYLESDSEDISIKGPDVINSKGDFDLNTMGLYATYNYQLPSIQGLYVKGKVGLVRVELHTRALATYRGEMENNPSSRSFIAREHDFGVGGGAALGYEVMPNLSIEGEYSYLDEDVQLASLGAHFKF